MEIVQQIEIQKYNPVCMLKIKEIEFPSTSIKSAKWQHRIESLCNANKTYIYTFTDVHA